MSAADVLAEWQAHEADHNAWIKSCGDHYGMSPEYYERRGARSVGYASRLADALTETLAALVEAESRLTGSPYCAECGEHADRQHVESCPNYAESSSHCPECGMNNQDGCIPDCERAAAILRGWTTEVMPWPQAHHAPAGSGATAVTA